MSPTTVKCNNCNIVICEVLAFLQNVLDVMDEESVLQLCTTSFTPEDIVKAKKLLCESLPSGKKLPVRRKDGKKKVYRDLEDMIGLLKGTDPELYPVFVAKDLHKIPPVTFDHVDVTRLLKDISKLQYKVSELEKASVTTEKFELLKQEVHDMKHASLVDSFQLRNRVNTRRGACLQNSLEYDSGPIGLHYVPIQQSRGTAVSKGNGRKTELLSKTLDQCDNNSAVPVLQDQEREIDCSGKEKRDDNSSDILCVSEKTEKKLVEEQTGANLSQSPTNGQRAVPVSAGSSLSEASWASKAAVQRASLSVNNANTE